MFTISTSNNSLYIKLHITNFRHTFYGWLKGKYVQIPKSVTYIEKGIFDEGCGIWVGKTYIKGYKGSYAYSYAKKYKFYLNLIFDF